MKTDLSHQLLIFVGSRCAGRVRQMRRLIESDPERYQPLKIVTTRTKVKDGDDLWYIRMLSHHVILNTFNIDQMLTFFEEGDAHYFITMQGVEHVQMHDRTPIVGMTPQGLARMISRQSPNAIIPFTAIVLQPEDPDDFRETLMREQRLSLEVAEEETKRAIRLSTFPPPVVHVGESGYSLDLPTQKTRGWSIIPVPIRGTEEDDSRVDDALRNAVTP